VRSGSRRWIIGVSILWLVAILLAVTRTTSGKPVRNKASRDIFANATDKITHGQQVFRFDTFGDQAFWVTR
jgi:hypothetical protein